MATFYGVPGPKTAAFERIEMEPRRRSGLLTQGGILALHGKADESSPVHRGKFVRFALLCGEVPPTPPGVDTQLPPAAAGVTTRERLADHTADVGCNACHRLMDGIGLGLEAFDGAGRYREMENGKPVDASGDIFGSDAAGPFVGAAALAQKLAASQDVRSCVVLQWFRFAYGRDPEPADQCTIDSLRETFTSVGGRFKDFVPPLARAVTMGGAQ